MQIPGQRVAMTVLGGTLLARTFTRIINRARREEEENSSGFVCKQNGAILLYIQKISGKLVSSLE